MTKEEKLKAIQEAIATKTTVIHKLCSFCENGKLEKLAHRSGNEIYQYYDCPECLASYYQGAMLREKIETNYAPIMIGDILDWMKHNLEADEFQEIAFYILNEWGNTRLPIDAEGNEKAVDEVYNLIIELGQA